MPSLLLLLACHGSLQHAPGLDEGRLAPCPSTPNCVSSQADPGDEEHYVAPLPLGGRSAEQALARLVEIVQAEPRTAVVQRDGAWLHATWTSLTWRYVDDVEFAVDTDAGVVHVRSSSRVGSTDFGVNRKRVQRIRDAWQ